MAEGKRTDEDTAHHVTFFGLSKVVIAVISSVAWMGVSSLLILLNKDLLSHGFHYPMALSALGMGFSGGASYLSCRVSEQACMDVLHASYVGGLPLGS